MLCKLQSKYYIVYKGISNYDAGGARGTPYLRKYGRELVHK